MSRRGRFAIVFLVAASAVAVVGPWVTSGARVPLSPVAWGSRGRVRVWRFFYRAHTGAMRVAYVDLPRWYGPDDDPRLPLIISPHGRQSSARANSAIWVDLPALGPFAVVNPEGQGRVLERDSWGAPGQIADLARMPAVLTRAFPWLRLDRHRIYGFGGSMGGQEVLLLAARYPHLLAGAAAFDAPTDLAKRYRDFRLLRTGGLLRRLLRIEVGGTPAQVPAAYAARSPLSFARRLAYSGVRLELWWSRADRVVVDQVQQSGRLYRAIKRFNPNAPVEEAVGRWGHTAELKANRELPDALLALGLIPPERLSDPAVAASATSRTSHVARPSLCAQPGGPRAFPWPLKPFHQQHPVRGGFGDPRTVFWLDGFPAGAGEGSFTFHNGVDIVAAGGTAVYAVASGVVDFSRPFTVGVRTNARRRFQYWHIDPLVRVGQHVVAGRTILGRVLPWAGHVHLSEIEDGRLRNPLAPGHLTPYRDATAPVVSGIVFRRSSGERLRPSRLDGEVRILAAAYDTPAQALPAAWRGARLAPALVRWRLTPLIGRPTLRERVVVDFRHRLPAEQDFWRVYAPQTYQNDPAIGLHHFGATPGQYVFSLTPRPLDTSMLRPGLYLITVTAADTCGNRGSLSERIRIVSPARRLSRRLDPPIMRVELHLRPDARTRPQLVLMTLGGPIYCAQLLNLARYERASLVCTDYGRNGYEGPGSRGARLEDWGDPAYLDAVATLPARLRREGVKISKLVLVGVSYSGFANAELAATHPELRPAALVVIDSYLDLPARYAALPPTHETTREIEKALGGTLAQRPDVYAARSPSHHLDGIADEVRHGMRFVDVWSVSADEKREFRGATCSEAANARWLSELARLLGRPVVGYVTQMQHAHALWDRGRSVLALAGIGTPVKPLPARRVTFQPGAPIPAGSYCT